MWDYIIRASHAEERAMPKSEPCRRASHAELTGSPLSCRNGKQTSKATESSLLTLQRSAPIGELVRSREAVQPGGLRSHRYTELGRPCRSARAFVGPAKQPQAERSLVGAPSGAQAGVVTKRRRAAKEHAGRATPWLVCPPMDARFDARHHLSSRKTVSVGSSFSS